MASGASRGGGTLIGRAFADARLVARQLAAMKVFPDRVNRVLSAIGGYDAAKTVRSKYDWTRTDSGPNSTVAAAGPVLRARARDLVRNNGNAARAINVLARSVVGTGILPRAVDETQSRRSTRLQRQANAVWKAWGKRGVADIEGQHTLDALTWIIAQAWLRDGEVFIRRRWDKKAGPVPMRIAVLESEMLDESITRSLDGGGRIIQGIELDANERRVAYWFRESHPHEHLLIGSHQSVRVPAEDVIHLFLPMRARQLRGLPFLAPAMVTIRDLGDYEGNELIRKKTEALVVAVNTPPAQTDIVADTDEAGNVLPIVPSTRNAAGDVVASMSAGAILGVENGGTVTFNSPQISGNYDTYKRAMLQGIAAAVEVTYEDLTTDLTGVNYSSYRAGRIQFNAHIDALQWLTFVPVVMDTLWDWCMGAAYLTGAIPKPIVPVEWATPKRLSVDPKKDVEADVAEMDAGLALRDAKLAERGEDPMLFREARATEEQADRDAGVSYAKPKGGAPPPAPAKPAEPPAEPGDEAAEEAE
jgi:lambda family phage portal protein